MRHDKMEKELRLMLILVENHKLDVNAICERMDISRRMFYYYLESFRTWGFKVEKDEASVYSIDRESPFLKQLYETINFTEDEAITIRKALDVAGGNNAIVDRINRKLANFYDYKILSDPEARLQAAHNITVLYEAIKYKRLVKIEKYSSPHSQSVCDRIVEPFLLMNNNNDVRCYELKSEMNKTFKISRMGNVTMYDLSWEHEERHKQVFTDIFMFSGEKIYPIEMRLGQLSHNLLVEEYPASAKYITQEDEHHWHLQMNVASYLGIGRFVLGLLSDIDVLGDEAFKNYLKNQLKENVKRF